MFLAPLPEKMPEKRCIILSPHLDDAALSCGGLIAFVSRTMRVEVWTIFTRGAWRGPYSPSALWLHGQTCTSNPIQLYAHRRAEDRIACNLLGARPRHFRWTDAPYRKDGKGRFLYPDALGPDMHPEDETLIAQISNVLKAQLNPSDTVLVPLSASSHIDHLIVRTAAEKAATRNWVYYPDLPYAAVRNDKGPFGKPMKQFAYQITQTQTAAWIAAVSCFATQIFMLQDASGSVQEMILSYASGGLTLFVPDQPDILLAAKAGLLSVLATARTPTPPYGIERLSDDSALLVNGGAESQGLEVASDRAPVAIFAFRRLDLLKKTLRALERCEGFSGREVIVFSDAARPGKPDEALAVANVRTWLHRWCHENGATLREAKKNRGLHVSITSGVTELLKTYERVIVLEDDLVVSPTFLNFMNDSLIAFADREEVVQVSGYMVPHEADLPRLGLLRAPGSWGWATWRRAWRHYRDDAVSLAAEVRKADPHAFDFEDAYANLEALDRNASGSLETWAVRWYASVFLRGGLTLYPSKSLVRNVGFGDDGTNCKPGPMAKVFSSQRIERSRVPIDAGSVDTSETPGYADATRKFYRWQQHQWSKPTFAERVRSSLTRLSPGQA